MFASLAVFAVWVAASPLIYQYAASLVPGFRDVVIAFALKFPLLFRC